CVLRQARPRGGPAGERRAEVGDPAFRLGGPAPDVAGRLVGKEYPVPAKDAGVEVPEPLAARAVDRAVVPADEDRVALVHDVERTVRVEPRTAASRRGALISCRSSSLHRPAATARGVPPRPAGAVSDRDDRAMAAALRSRRGTKARRLPRSIRHRPLPPASGPARDGTRARQRRGVRMPYDEPFRLPRRYLRPGFLSPRSAYSELHDYDFEMRGP